MFAGKKLGKKALEAGKAFRAADEATRAQMISKFGGRALKVAGVAALGAMTGGVGLAAVAGVGMTGAIVVKDKKFRAAHPEAAEISNSRVGGAMTGLSDEQQAARATVVSKALENMSDAQKQAFAGKVNAAGLKIDGEKLTMGEDGSFSIGKNKVDLNDPKNAALAARIQSRVFGTLGEDEKKAVIKDMKSQEKQDNEDPEVTASKDC